MTKAQHITLVVSTDLTYDQRMQRISTSLQKGGYQVLLVGRKKQSSLPLSKAIYQQKRIRIIIEKGPLFYALLNIRLFLFLLFKPTDIICATDLDTVFAVALVKKLRPKLKMVFDAHEFFTEVPELQGRTRIQGIWSKIGAWSVPKADLAYTVGEALAQQFSKDYGMPFYTIRNMSVSKIGQPRTMDTSRPFTLYYQGALNAGRGLEALIEAMVDLPNCVLQLAGEGDLSTTLKHQVKDLGVQDNVQFLGYVLPSDLDQYLSKADLGLNLLENNGLSYYYSLANKTFDYMQFGLPAIHMNFPEYQNLQEQWNCFYLLDDLDVDTIVRTMRAILADPSSYASHSTKSLEAAQVLNWEREKQQLLRLYHQLQ